MDAELEKARAEGIDYSRVPVLAEPEGEKDLDYAGVDLEVPVVEPSLARSSQAAQAARPAQPVRRADPQPEAPSGFDIDF